MRSFVGNTIVSKARPLTPPGLFSARQKVSHANAQIEAFAEELADFEKNHGPRVVTVVDPKTQIETVKLIVPQLPIIIPLLIGDILHNVRGALDHATSAIVSNVTKNIDRRVTFPFHETKREFIAKKETHTLYKTAPDVWQIIEEDFRPYKSEDGNEILWGLSKLNNIDKHRLVLTTYARGFTSQDVMGPNYNAKLNLHIQEGPGELVIAQGKGLNVSPRHLSCNIVITEPDIVRNAPLPGILNEFARLAFRIVDTLETHVFGKNTVSK